MSVQSPKISKSCFYLQAMVCRWNTRKKPHQSQGIIQH